MFYVPVCATHLFVTCLRLSSPLIVTRPCCRRSLLFQYLLCDLLFSLLQKSHHGCTSVGRTIALQHDLRPRSNLGILRIRGFFTNNGTVMNHAIRRLRGHDLEALFSRIQRLCIRFMLRTSAHIPWRKKEKRLIHSLNLRREGRRGQRDRITCYLTRDVRNRDDLKDLLASALFDCWRHCCCCCIESLQRELATMWAAIWLTIGVRRWLVYRGDSREWICGC